MGNTFAEILKNISKKKKSFLCVGLDPDLEKLPSGITKDCDGIVKFNTEIIKATSPYAAAFKPNLAFYEALGLDGLKALEKTLKVIPDDVIVIGDAKRSDISNTSKKYAQSLFNSWGFDAITVNPYLGRDSIEPFLEYEDKGVFVLCLTSNKGANDFQIPEKLYLKIAQYMNEINKKNNCGLVVGATHPEHIKEIRQNSGDMPFLIPGVGAQGGEIKNTVENAKTSDGMGFLINASRSIIYASSKNDFAELAAINAKQTMNDINQALLI